MNDSNKSPHKILVVDDTTKNLQVIATLLSSFNYELAFAKNGIDAIKIAEQLKPHLILLDIMMPEMDGFEACEKLKQSDKTKDIPIIFITAKTETKDIIKGFQLGAVDYITKPFNKEELIARVKNHIRIVDYQDSLIKQQRNIEAIMFRQDRLYSIIAHDIRSPLNNINLILNSVKQNRLCPESVEFLEFIEILKQSTARTSALLENLLIWTKNKTGALNKQMAYFNLSELMQECIVLFETSFIQKELIVESNIPQNMHIKVDREMIKTVFRNFISNAIKFSHRKGKIEISASENEKEIELRFKDYGLGFNLDHLDKIFREDIHYTSPGTEKEMGSGFGLILCKNFIEQNKGTFCIQSEENKGCEIIIKLPNLYREEIQNS